jgi:o-succinylbenzoate synthase
MSVEQEFHFVKKEVEIPFKEPLITSRGTYTSRKVVYLCISFDGKHWGIGEVAPLPDLSKDRKLISEEETTKALRNFCKKVLKEETSRTPYASSQYPSLDFATTTAIAHLKQGGIECTQKDIESLRFMHMKFPAEQWKIVDTPFTRGESGIQINGLVWMGTLEEMKARAQAKIYAGYRCIKVKIGALHFEEELELLRYIRAQRTPEQLELRVDANGAFTPEEAPEKLRRLAEFGIHSIEQPIRAAQWDAMAELVKNSPIPIALDEELIGNLYRRRKLIETIRPDYLVYKPSLIGFTGMTFWIEALRNSKVNSKFWVTSALETNIGLNAIAQFTSLILQIDGTPKMAQGLGTGQLFTENVDIPLTIEGDCLYFNKK